MRGKAHNVQPVFVLGKDRWGVFAGAQFRQWCTEKADAERAAKQMDKRRREQMDIERGPRKGEQQDA